MSIEYYMTYIGKYYMTYIEKFLTLLYKYGNNTYVNIVSSSIHRGIRKESCFL